MADIWVVNASPLISLGTIGRVDLLTRLADEVYVPAAVRAEVCRVQDAASAAVAGAGALRRVECPVIDPTIAVWGLGRGETEVLSVARGMPGCEAVLDDRMARCCAKAFGIQTRGTLGVVLLAKERGAIAAAAPVIEELLRAGLRLHPSLVAQALSLVGEEA